LIKISLHRISVYESDPRCHDSLEFNHHILDEGIIIIIIIIIIIKLYLEEKSSLNSVVIEYNLTPL